MDCYYSSSCNFTPSLVIPGDDCVWSDYCTFTTDYGGVYPSVALTRVTSLVHRWSPGKYTLQMGLGEVISEFVLGDRITRPYDVPIPGPPNPPPGGCPEGKRRCFDADLYECINKEWVLVQSQAPECVYEPAPSECDPGTYKCVGNDLYECVNGRWVIAGYNHPWCMNLPY